MALSLKAPEKMLMDIGRTPEAASYLASELERLMGLPLASKSDVALWLAEKDKVCAELKERFPNFEFAHQVWHFFDDADICARDVGYKEHQHRRIRAYIRDLRGLPDDS